MGDIAVFYTDGVTEAINSSGELYGLGRLSEAITKCSNLTAQEIMGTILEDISSFSGSQDQYDDITLIVVKAEDTSGKAYEIIVPAKEEEIPRISEFVKEVMTAEEFSMQKVLNTQLAVEEACINIIEHGYKGGAGSIRISIDPADDRLIMTIEDEGRQFDPTKAPELLFIDDIEKRTAEGLGLHLMRSFVEDVRYEFRDGKNTQMLVIRRS